MRILLAESDGADALRTAQTLRSTQIVVDSIATGSGALKLMRFYEYDALLISFTLPDMEACELLRRLRKAGIDIPVLVLFNSTNATGLVKAFDHGADDVVSVPVESAELIARVHAVVRRAHGYSHPALQVGVLELDLASRSLLVNGRPVHLTSKEFALLTLLMQRKDRVISKESFLSHLYGGVDEPEIKIIDVFMCKVRRKLAEAGADNVISTVWGTGYIMRDPTPVNPVHSDRKLAAPGCREPESSPERRPCYP